jgi:hypothetical protein
MMDATRQAALNASVSLRARSKLLFGNADRLQVAAAVARASAGVVHAQEISNLLGISPPRVRSQLLALSAAGLLCQLPRHGMTVDYERVDDPFWDAVAGLVEAWT